MNLRTLPAVWPAELIPAVRGVAHAPRGSAEANADCLCMRRLAEGEDGALNELMDRHSKRLFGYLFRSLQSAPDAEDLAQETFVRVYRHRSDYDPRQRFQTWLYAIASNLVRDRFRWRRRHPQVSLDEPPGFNRVPTLDRLQSSNAANAGEEMDCAERTALIRAAVGELPENLRTPLILSVFEEVPQIEIARILRCSVKSVETRIYRARNLLRAKLQKGILSACR